MRRNGIVYATLITFVLTGGISLILTIAHVQTQDRVIENELVRRQGAVLRAMGVPVAGRDETMDRYGSLERVATEDGTHLYRIARVAAAADGIIATTFTGPGVWGEITAVIAVTEDVSRVIGIEIIDHRETPGLGGRVATPAFLDQFVGERIGPDGIQVVVRGPGDTDPDNAAIDGITGATGTTRAFDRMLNRELARLRAELATVAVDGSVTDAAPSM